ncbi:FecR family protein [Snuella sedimenti]|uniref:FecR domain-containing protein n=1 Tax=Snuella sedimenti TaxID=2798802 RepID=A0A8J7IXA6_9FLAO|nr:FecR domain-containing protein [Snuella sedimenti]MBJ6368920.1 FecR domain-containing protein [Snuella sedimenti]
MSKVNDHILKLIAAYTANNISKSQLNDLQKWLQEVPENKQLFADYLQLYKKSQRIGFIEHIDIDNAWKSVVEKLERPLAPKAKTTGSKLRSLSVMRGIFKYAAVVVFLLGIGYLLQKAYFNKPSESVFPSENITLQLEDGSIEIIKLNTSSNIVDAKGNIIVSQKGNQLVYTSETDKDTLVYNTLTVPYGKRFKIMLSDGTNVNLNAGTSLKYPVKFIKGENRQVFLDGEAYFDVAKDANHPFVVNANAIDVRVLGTQFNVSSYPEDETISTVLVEGAVSVHNKKVPYKPETATYLKPGFKAAWDKKYNSISIDKADVEMHTAWISGKIIFRHIPFDDIVRKLERHYNVVIKNNNKDLGKDFITATFDIETIEQVFKYINELHPIDYTIKNNLITIN